MELDLNGRVARTVQLRDGVEVDTVFTYEAFDAVDDVTDAEGQLIDFEYDKLGRTTMVDDPNDGITTQAWNGFNEAIGSADAAGTTTYTRDALGRVTSIVDVEGTSQPGPLRAEHRAERGGNRRHGVDERCRGGIAE